MYDYIKVHELEYDENNMPKIKGLIRLKCDEIDVIKPLEDRPYEKYPLSKEDLATNTLKSAALSSCPSKIILNEFTDPKTYIVAETKLYLFIKMGIWPEGAFIRMHPLNIFVFKF